MDRSVRALRSQGAMSTSSRTDLFAGIRQVAVGTAAGPVALPILYRDGSLLVVGYRIDPARASSALAGLALEPLVTLGRALVLLSMFEYRDTSIGPYNEIGIALLAQRAGTAPSTWRLLRDARQVLDAGLYVTNLPVTTPVACSAGVEIWGYPKYVTGIATDFRADGVTVTLENEFVLTHSRRYGLEVAGVPMITYTSKSGRLIRTVTEVGHRMRFGGAGTVELKIIGDGPTAATLRALGLDAARPAFAMRTDAVQAVLPFGKDIGAAGT
ncbi:MAG TPA: acetoacetate decarboxylase family protein [Steroidobacteraceae bacterium]